MGYIYKVVYKNDGLEVEATGNSLKDIKEKTGLSKNMIAGRELRDKSTKVKKFTRPTNVLVVEKKKIRYKCVKDNVEHEFNDLKQGAAILGVSIATVHRILKSDKLKDKHNITIIN